MSIRRIHVARTAVAVALASAFPSVFAEQSGDDAVIVVTASRFRGDDRSVAANVTTITSADIAAAPAGNLPDLLATRAGIDVSSLYGSQGADTAISLRGFGENASLRTLVIVDGRRLDQLEFVTPNWSSIPLDSIERIEIVRGSGSVLYGDQAVAGVINIVTHRGKENAADVALTLGSFDSKAVSASISRNDTPLRFAVTATHKESDEYRRNNAHRNTTGSARIARDFANGELYAEIGASEIRYELPGAVTAAQYANDPRASETTDSWFKRENHYLRPGLRWQATPDLELAVELSLEQSHNRSWISNWPSWRDTVVGTTAVSPRLRWSHGFAGLPSTTVVGFDWSDASLDQDRALTPGGAVTKTVKLDREGGGFYIHNTTEPLAGVAVTLGAREHRFRSRATDSTVAGVTESTEKKSATEFGVAWKPAEAWKLFAKASTTFRYPVLDEWTTWGGFAAPPPRPESGRGTDFGVEWRAAGHSVQVTRYDLRMEDEIAWNNLTFQNENLQKTRHRGFEIDSRWRLAADWRLDLSWSGREATFREGANAGNAIPLVPETRWTAALSWNGGRFGRHTLLANHVGARHFGGDEGNVRAKLPAHTTVDWQSGWQMAQWELGLRVANLTDRKYSPTGFDYGFGASYYPANPRAAYLTARHRF
jgi:iron complex outermembrane receptor protein